MPARRTKAVEPIAGNIYADHGCCWYHITLSSLCFAVPQNGPPSTVRDGEERRDQPASDRGLATRCSAPYPTPSQLLAGSRDGANVADPRHIRCSVPACGGTGCHGRSPGQLHCALLCRGLEGDMADDAQSRDTGIWPCCGIHRRRAPSARTRNAGPKAPSTARPQILCQGSRTARRLSRPSFRRATGDHRHLAGLLTPR